MKTKEIRLRPNIADHDLQVKSKAVRKFLEKKLKVRITMTFKGREASHKGLGLTVIDKLLADLEGLKFNRSKVSDSGNIITFTLS